MMIYNCKEPFDNEIILDTDTNKTYLYKNEEIYDITDIINDYASKITKPEIIYRSGWRVIQPLRFHEKFINLIHELFYNHIYFIYKTKMFLWRLTHYQTHRSIIRDMENSEIRIKNHHKFITRLIKNRCK